MLAGLCVAADPDETSEAFSQHRIAVRESMQSVADRYYNAFAENTGKLQVHHIHVPNPFILGSSSDLMCNYSWTHPQHESRPIYSIKWYKENAEFFR